MSCNGNEECPKHGKQYMRKVAIIPGGTTKEQVCRGCHAGEIAAGHEYIKRETWRAKDSGGRGVRLSGGME